VDGVAYGAALALAALFGWAGAVKLAGRHTTVRTFEALGLRAPRALAIGVPVVELGLAAGLVVAPGWAALAALAVLAGFTTILWRALRSGTDVGCGCFGTTSRRPVSAVELVRNGVLATGASLAAAAPGPVVPAPGAVAVVAVGAAVGAALVRLAARRVTGTDATRRADARGPRPGSAAPALPGHAYGDAPLTVVAFTAPTCGGCDGLRAALDRLVGAGPAVRFVELGDATGPTFEAFGVTGAPTVVVVDHLGVVRARGPADGGTDLDVLLDVATGAAQQARSARRSGVRHDGRHDGSTTS
jgi:hypothetical protein